MTIFRTHILAGLLALYIAVLAACTDTDSSNDAPPPPDDYYSPQVGDIIFQSSAHTPLVDMIEGATDSHYSHCGIVDQQAGQWVVYEASVEVQAMPLKAFTDKGRDGGFAVYRFKPEYNDNIPEIIEHTRNYLGRPYDFRYRLDEEYIYCSELIYKAFEQATGQTMGKLTRLGDMDWQPHEPLIRRLEAGPVPLDREIISPIDLAQADQLEVVYTQDFEVTER